MGELSLEFLIIILELSNASLEQQGGGFSLQDGRAERGVHVSVEFVSFARRVAVDRFV